MTTPNGLAESRQLDSDRYYRRNTASDYDMVDWHTDTSPKPSNGFWNVVMQIFLGGK